MKAPADVGQLPVSEVEGTYQTTSGGFDAVGFKALFGFDLDASAETNFVNLNLPLEFRITAPETVAPGSTISLRTELALAPSAAQPLSFSTRGTASIDTSLRYDVGVPGVSGRGEVDLPDSFGFEGVNLQTGNSDDFAATYRAGDPVREVVARNYFTEDEFGNFLSPKAQSYAGYQISGTGTIDGVEIGADLYDAATTTIPPLVPLAVANPIIDLNANIGVDLAVTNTLTTNLATAYFTHAGQSGTGVLRMNGTAQTTQIKVPDTLAPGDTFDVTFFGLGLGFNILTELGLLGNFDIDLAAEIFGVGRSTELLGRDFTDPLNFDAALTRYYQTTLVSDLLGFDPADAVLSMAVSGSTCDIVTVDGRCLVSTGPPNALPDGIDVGSSFLELIENDASILSRIFFDGISEPPILAEGSDLPSAAAIVLPVETTPVPLPTPALFLLFGVAVLLGFRRISS